MEEKFSELDELDEMILLSFRQMFKGEEWRSSINHRALG